MRQLLKKRQPSRHRLRGRGRPCTAALARALGHDLRLKIVLRSATSLSPRELVARERDVSLETALYHFKALFEAGLLDVAESARLRADVRYTAPPWALELCERLEKARLKAGTWRWLLRVQATLRDLLGGRR